MATVCVTGSVGRDAIAAQDIPSSATSKQLAEAIARTMAATNPAMPAGTGISQEITSHGNIVESRLTFSNAEAFGKLAAHRADVQTALTRFMCGADRRPYLDRGVVFRNVDIGPGPSESFDFIIDARACALQASGGAADTGSRNVEAQNVARQLKGSLSSDHAAEGLRLDGVSATNGTVHVAYQVRSPAWIERLKTKDYKVRGITQGWVCGAIGSAIRKGVRVEVVYKGREGSPRLAFSVDGSTC